MERNTITSLIERNGPKVAGEETRKPPIYDIFDDMMHLPSPPPCVFPDCDPTIYNYDEDCETPYIYTIDDEIENEEHGNSSVDDIAMNTTQTEPTGLPLLSLEKHTNRE